MNVLLTGGSGQLGQALQATAPADVRLSAPAKSEFDITRPDSVKMTVDRARASLIINCAAYTRVDEAEKEQALAFAVNAEGVAHITKAAVAVGARLFHISTDYVFDGRQSSPYLPLDRVAPLSVYGASKRAGEEHALNVTNERALIIRTSWLYGASGNNFVKTMLRLMREKNELRVVTDQVGTPTWAHTLAQFIWVAAMKPTLRGIYHWTDAGTASWYDFAVAIQEEALALQHLTHAIPIYPIRTQEYPTAARRPAYSVLDKSDAIADVGVSPTPWRIALHEMLQGLLRA